MRMVVVGAGVVGLWTAREAGRAGHEVVVLDRDGIGGGATRWSFGWVGLGSEAPSADPTRWEVLAEALRLWPRDAPRVASGALVWEGAEAATAAFAEELRAAGVRVDLLGRGAVGAIEPALAAPSLAAHVPDDFAVEPATLCAWLARGLDVRRAEALGVAVAGGRARGVRTPEGVLAADAVVLACGAEAWGLAAAVGVALEVREDPAALVRLLAPPGTLRGLVAGPALRTELRPGAGGLASATEAPADGDGDAEAARVLARARTLLPGAPLRVAGWGVGMRPMAERPVAGPLALPGLHAAMGHPGVMLAPWMARGVVAGLGAA